MSASCPSRRSLGRPAQSLTSQSIAPLVHRAFRAFSPRIPVSFCHTALAPPLAPPLGVCSGSPWQSCRLRRWLSSLPLHTRVCPSSLCLRARLSLSVVGIATSIWHVTAAGRVRSDVTGQHSRRMAARARRAVSACSRTCPASCRPKLAAASDSSVSSCGRGSNAHSSYSSSSDNSSRLSGLLLVCRSLVSGPVLARRRALSRRMRTNTPALRLLPRRAAHLASNSLRPPSHSHQHPRPPRTRPLPPLSPRLSCNLSRPLPTRESCP